MIGCWIIGCGCQRGRFRFGRMSARVFLAVAGFCFSLEEICAISASIDEARFSKRDADGIGSDVRQWIYDPVQLSGLVRDFGVVRCVRGVEKPGEISVMVYSFGWGCAFGDGGTNLG